MKLQSQYPVFEFSSAFVWKWNVHANQTHFHVVEKVCKRTSLETEEKGNLAMAYYMKTEICHQR